MNSQERLREAFRLGWRIRSDGVPISPLGTEVATNLDKSGYPRFTVRLSDMKHRPIYVHRLIALEKYGEAVFAPGIQVRHRDGNPLNTDPSNILIGTPSENAMDKPREVRVAVAGRAARRLTDAQVRELRSDRLQGASYSELSVKYGIQKSTISYIVRGKTKYEGSELPPA